MKMEVLRTSVSGGITVMEVEHKGEKLTWDVSMHDRSKVKCKDRMVEHINGYFSSLTVEQNDGLFALYRKMHDLFQTVHEYEALVTVLQLQIKRFYKIATPDSFGEWLALKGNVGFPSTVLDDYVYDGKYSNIDRFQERTCLKSDYRKILNLSLASHAMLPVLGEFIARTEKIVGVNYKELKALPILTESDLFKMPGVEWLTNYISAALARAAVSDSAVIAGLGSMDVPDWLLARVLIRKLPIEEFHVDGDDGNLIIKVFHVINNGLTGRDRNFLGPVTDKFRDKVGTDADKDRSSFAEKIKIKTETSIGDREPDSVFLEKYVQAALKLVPDLNPNRAKECVEFAINMQNPRIMDHAVTMAQWIMAPAISPLSLPLTEARDHLFAIGISQAILWHWGFIDLASLMTAQPVPHGRESVHAGLEVRARIPKELMEELAELFPYHQVLRGRQQSMRKLNPGCISVDEFNDLIAGSEWIVNCPPELSSKTTKVSSRRMLVPSDVRIQLGNLIVKHIAQRS